MKCIQFISLIFATFFLAWNINQSHGLRILGLFPFHVRSHYVMCEELMLGLAAKGHQVDVYSHFPLGKTVSNFNHFSLNGTLPAIFNNMTFNDAMIETVSLQIKHWLTIGNDVCKLMEHPLFQKLLHDPPRDPPYDLVINELSVANCYLPIGRHLKIPLIGVVTSPMIDWLVEPFGVPMNLATDSTLLSSYVAPMTFFERLDNVMTYYTTIHSFNKHILDQNQYVEKFFGTGYPNVIELMKDVSLVLVNHDSAISGIRSFSPIVVPVGGLHVVDHNDTLSEIVQKWLDDSKDGCIYFSFGSMARIETFPRHLLEAFYNSFRHIAPVRVLLKIAKPEELPPGVPSNVLIQPWFQQIQVLKHKNVKAFVTHGGLMGTQESIYFGVPLVIVPLFGDQKFNAKSYVNKKIGIKLDLHEITQEKFTRALTEIIKNDAYKKAVQKLSNEFKNRPLSPINTAVFWIEYIHTHGKNALRSPVVDMPWWQANLLDVYGFIAAILFVSLYIAIKVLKLIINLLLSILNNGSKLKTN